MGEIRGGERRESCKNMKMKHKKEEEHVIKKEREKERVMLKQNE